MLDISIVLMMVDYGLHLGILQFVGLQHFHFWCIQGNRSRRGFSSRKAALP
jgi:hypothetical protein